MLGRQRWRFLGGDRIGERRGRRGHHMTSTCLARVMIGIIHRPRAPQEGRLGAGEEQILSPGFGLWNGHPWHPSQTSFRSPLPSSRGTFLSGALFVTTALSSYPKVSFPGPHPPRTVLPGIGCKPASVSFRRLPSLPFEGWPSIRPLRLENSLSRSTSCF